MLKKDEISDPTSCLNTAHNTDLVFVLKEPDPAMADTIRYWIEKRIEFGINLRTDKKIGQAELIASCVENSPRHKVPRPKDSAPLAKWTDKPEGNGIFYCETCDQFGNPVPGLIMVDDGNPFVPIDRPTKYFGPIHGACRPWETVPAEKP